jgi:hypothetical protein
MTIAHKRSSNAAMSAAARRLPLSRAHARPAEPEPSAPHRSRRAPAPPLPAPLSASPRCAPRSSARFVFPSRRSCSSRPTRIARSRVQAIPLNPGLNGYGVRRTYRRSYANYGSGQSFGLRRPLRGAAWLAADVTEVSARTVVATAHPAFRHALRRRGPRATEISDSLVRSAVPAIRSRSAERLKHETGMVATRVATIHAQDSRSSSSSLRV